MIVARSTYALTCLFAVGLSVPVAADSALLPLVVQTGRPLRIQLDDRTRVRRVGQPVSGTVVQPVYAYDRVVIPSGSKATGRIVELRQPSKWTRLRSMLGGQFSSLALPVPAFDELILADGTTMAISTEVTSRAERLAVAAVPGPAEAPATNAADRARHEAANRVRQAIDDAKQRMAEAAHAVKEPGKLERLKEAAVNQLPYHPQYMGAGTVFNARLLAPVSFGTVSVDPDLPPSAAPAPETVLRARLVTELDSSKTPRGTPMQAVLTEPVFAPTGELVLPEGTTFDGEVTYAKPAASLHRNGQLRFLVESIHAPAHSMEPLLASLVAVEAGQSAAVALDDEGGARAVDSKTRFIAPALAVLATRAALDDGHHGFDNDADDVPGAVQRTNNRLGARGVAGFIGFGLVGVAVSQISRPAGVALGVWGAAQTVYANILGKGREVSFPADTPIQLQLAPARSSP